MSKIFFALFIASMSFLGTSTALAERQPLLIKSYGYSVVVTQKVESELPTEKTAVLLTGETSEAYFRIFRQRVGKFPEVGTQFAACEEVNGFTFKLFEIAEDYFVKLASFSQESDQKTCRGKATEVNLRLPLVKE